MQKRKQHRTHHHHQPSSSNSRVFHFYTQLFCLLYEKVNRTKKKQYIEKKNPTTDQYSITAIVFVQQKILSLYNNNDDDAQMKKISAFVISFFTIISARVYQPCSMVSAICSCYCYTVVLYYLYQPACWYPYPSHQHVSPRWVLLELEKNMNSIEVHRFFCVFILFYAKKGDSQAFMCLIMMSHINKLFLPVVVLIIMDEKWIV